MNVDAATRRARNEALLFVLLVGAMIGSLFLLVHPWYDATNDGSTYILTARSIADGEGYRYLGETFRLRPPGFSWILAMSDPDGRNFGIYNMMISLFGVAGAALLFLHQRPRVGAPLAALLSAAVWLNPGYRRLCTEVMSDVPGLTLVLACLLLERWAASRPDWKRELLLGVAIGLGAYVRSIVVLLVPAILVARLVARLAARRSSGPSDTERTHERGWGRFLFQRFGVVTVAAWLVLLPWNVTRQRDLPPPPAEQTLNYTLGTAMWHEDPGDPGSRSYRASELLARIPPRMKELALVVGSRLQHRIPGSPVPTAAAALGYGALALVFAGCWLTVLVRRRSPAEWFVAGAAFVVSIYFVFTDRLALPLFVFALAATVEVLRGLARRFAGTRAATLVPAAALLLLIAVDFAPRRGWNETRSRHFDFMALAAAVEATVPADARLAAGQGFHYAVFLDRPVYSLMHAARRGGGPEAVEAVIDKHGIDTVILSPLVPPDLPLAPYFTLRYGPGTPAGRARIWRVRDPAR